MSNPDLFSYNYPRMLVTVDAVVFCRDNSNSYKVLLIKRGNEPFKGQFALPGGFPEMNEFLVDAAKRELKEETGITGIPLEILGVFDNPSRDPRDRNIAIAYFAVIPDELTAVAGDDAVETKWMPLNNLPPLAFDHVDIINKARQRYRL